MATLHMQLDFPVPKGTLGPSNSIICPRPAPKRPPKAPKIVHIGRQQRQTKKQTISWATWLKMQCQAHLIHPQPPTFGGFHPLKLPYPTPGPPYLGPVGCGKLQEVAQRGGCKNGSTRSTGCEKMAFFKNDPRRHGMPKQVFLVRFQLVVARCGPPKIAKCLENRLFWNKKWVKKVFFQN